MSLNFNSYLYQNIYFQNICFVLLSIFISYSFLQENVTPGLSSCISNYTKHSLPTAPQLIDTIDNDNCIEICDNGQDDDLDGLIDYYDDDCHYVSQGCTDFFYQPYIEYCNPPFFSQNVEVDTFWYSSGVDQGSVPMVADIDGDCLPDVVYIEWQDSSNIKVINGANGNTKFTFKLKSDFTNNDHNLPLTPALGDCDHDGMAEIFVCLQVESGEFNLFRIDYNPATLQLEEQWRSNFRPLTNDSPTYAPSLADFNADGITEVVLGNQIFNAETGILLVDGFDNNNGVSYYAGFNNPYSTIAADVLSSVDCANCSGLELVAGSQVYAVNLVSYTNPSLNSLTVEREVLINGNRADGSTSIVDFDRDGDLDIVVNSPHSSGSSQIFIWDVNTQQLIGQPFHLGTYHYLAPCIIGDVDHDGWPEIVVAAPSTIYLLHDYNAGGGVSWGASTTTISNQYFVSDLGFAAPTLFDFEGDSLIEIVIRDQSNLIIFDHRLNELSRTPCQSPTLTEYPVIADINDDDEAEILCFCRSNSPNTDYLTAFKSKGQPWSNTRKIWNQFNYFVVNINDDGSIPTHQQAHHIIGDSIVLNNYLQQYAIPQKDTSIDVSLKVDSVYCDDDVLVVSVEICNNKKDLLDVDLPISLYMVKEDSFEIVSTDQYSLFIAAEDCNTLLLALPSHSIDSFLLVVNTKDQIIRSLSNLETINEECLIDNNYDFGSYTTKPNAILDLGPDLLICDNGIEVLSITEDFDHIRWFDESSAKNITVFEPGTYWVEAWNDCGESVFDTINIQIDSSSVLKLPNDTSFCVGSSIILNIDGFTSYNWTPGQFLDCDTCQTVTFFPDATTTYELTVESSAGCYSKDTMQVRSLPSSFIVIDTSACVGDSIIFDTIALYAGEQMTFRYLNRFGCDSIIQFNVQQLNPAFATIDTTICANDELLINQTNLQVGVDTTFMFTSSNGCDSVIRVIVRGIDTLVGTIDTMICEGESIFYQGEEMFAGQNKSFSSTSAKGCDSVTVVSVQIADNKSTYIEKDTAICFGQSITFEGVNLFPEDEEEFMFQTLSGCDSIINYKVFGLDTFNIAIDTFVCLGQEIELFGNLITETGIYADKLQTFQGCDSLVKYQVFQNQAIVQSPVVDVSCYGYQDGQFLATFPMNSFTIYLNDILVSNSSQFESLDTGSFALLLIDRFGCEQTQNFTIGQPVEIVINLPTDTIIRVGNTYDIIPNITPLGNYQYQWTPATYLSCDDCELPNAVPTQDIQYVLTVENIQGCTAQDDINIYIETQHNIIIPNAFSPNDDGQNESFFVKGPLIKQVKSFKVYDRWGNAVFKRANIQANDPNQGWDGKSNGQKVLNGVYVYNILILMENDETIRFSGDITVMR